MVNIPSNNQDDIWKYLSNVQTLINIYRSDFLEENKKLTDKEKEIRVLIRKEKQNNIDLSILKSFSKEEWKTLILKGVNKIQNKIKSRITKGIGFSDILIQINKIEEDLIDITDYELEWFENIYYSDIMRLRQDTKERIDNERFYIIFAILVAVLVGAIFFILGTYFQSH